MVKKKEPARKRYSFRFSEKEVALIDSLRMKQFGENRTHVLRRLLFEAAEKQAR